MTVPIITALLLSDNTKARNNFKMQKPEVSNITDTLLPIACPKPHGTAAASTSPIFGLRFFLALGKL